MTTLATIVRMFDKLTGADVDLRAWSNGDGTYSLLPLVGTGDAWTGDALTADQAVAVRDVSNTRATYRASVNGLVASSSQGFALSDIFTLAPSSSNQQVTRVKRVGLAVTGGGGTYVDVLLQRRSSRDSSGTSPAAPTAVSMDPLDPASGALLQAFNTSPSSSAGLGVLVGQIASVRLFAPSSSAASQTYPWEFEFGEITGSKSPVLRSTSASSSLTTDLFAVSIVPDSAGPFKVDVWAQWTEAAA